MLEIKNVSKRFGLTRALNGVSLELGPGIYGILGPNGAGKTTLMRTICGIYDIQQGSICWDGKSIVGNKEFSRQIGYLPQKFGMFREMTVYEMLEYLAILRDIPKEDRPRAIRAALEAVNLSDKREDKVRTLSGGMLRRAGIAQAIMGEPRIVIFDEPTAGLDPEERTRFKNVLAQLPQSCTVLLSTHIVEDVEATCNKIIIMDKGNVAHCGPVKEVCDIGEGRIWSVPLEKKAQLVEPYYLIRYEGRYGPEALRVISNEPQPGTPREPRIEDGYLCRIKGFG